MYFALYIFVLPQFTFISFYRRYYFLCHSSRLVLKIFRSSDMRIMFVMEHITLFPFLKWFILFSPVRSLHLWIFFFKTEILLINSFYSSCFSRTCFHRLDNFSSVLTYLVCHSFLIFFLPQNFIMLAWSSIWVFLSQTLTKRNVFLLMKASNCQLFFFL